FEKPLEAGPGRRITWIEHTRVGLDVDAEDDWRLGTPIHVVENAPRARVKSHASGVCRIRKTRTRRCSPGTIRSLALPIRSPLMLWVTTGASWPSVSLLMPNRDNATVLDS